MLVATTSRGILTYKKMFPFFVSGPWGTTTFAVAIVSFAIVSTVGRVTKRQEVEYVYRLMAAISDVAFTHRSL